ncbi:MAG: carbamoyltransferase HypF [Nitrospira bacterium SG8_35_1]|nr:MAG: carbamoyltransferase HypF [Nitrospira bacterium SG8_35_1]
MRIRVHINGVVQGVGFRPFVFRLANELGLKGYVLNHPEGVSVEAEGEKKKLYEFLVRVEKEKPAIAKIYSLQYAFLEATGADSFEIRVSNDAGERKVSILPDIAVCDECMHEVTDPKDRRFIYPFTNCTNCGPRYTIIQSLPYDRKNTSMKSFVMCPDCEKEYTLASFRRFHAQPNACHECGPWITLHDCDGQLSSEKSNALEKVTNLIRKGYIIAVKGIGGYHLVCDAESNEAVQRLRERKQREEKPMAVMFPDLDSIMKEAVITPIEARALASIERPIVIVRKKDESTLAPSVSPDNSTVGVFLPYTPLHHLIARKLKKPVVATSANVSDDPIVKDEPDAFARLSKIADYFLTHNRDIIRQCDDSVVRIIAERQVPIRRSRGFAPLPIQVPFQFRKPVLALGPSMNNTIAAGIDNKVYLSQHIGDLDSPLAIEFYEETIHDFLRLLDIQPEIVVSDLHPGYYSTKFGEKHFDRKLVRVQHHFAHILSCLTDNSVPEETEVIGFAFDGTGYGPDGTVWGSEVFIASYSGFKRAYHLRPFRLPGGDRSVREPCRTALSLLYETFGDAALNIRHNPLSDKEKSFLIEMIKKEVHSPVTTGMGRLFDGVASLINVKQKISYHAQAAIALEQAALKSDRTDSYPFRVSNDEIDQRAVIEAIVKDVDKDTAPEIIARKFHNTIVDIVVSIAESLRKETGIATVALTGGVFQNALLSENSFERLTEKGFTPLLHQLVPPNDGGIALGQTVYGQFLA